MEELKQKAGELTDSVSEYIKTYYKLSVLKVADKATGITASALASIVIAFLSFFVLLFSGIAMGIWLGTVVNSVALGFLLVGAIYLLFIFIILGLKKKVVFPMIRNSIINKLYE